MSTKPSEDLEIIPTRAMLAKNVQNKSSFTGTVFEARKKLPKSTTLPHQFPASSKHKQIDDSGDNVFDIKKAKHEVLNFGIGGHESKDKRLAKIALAVKLGAKPEKKQYKNYKLLLEEKRQTKNADREEEALWKIGKNAQGGASVTYKKHKNAQIKRKLNGPITTHYGIVKPKIVGKRKK